MTDKKTLYTGSAAFGILSVICWLSAPFTHEALIGAAIGLGLLSVSFGVIAMRL